MGAPYQRQDTSNNIANGNIINADDLDNEFNAIEGAFASVTGHSHDGTTGEGGPITVVGPAQDLIVSGTQVLPKTNNTLDLGSASFKFKDAYVDGILYADGINFNGTAISATAAQINHLVGVTSSIQTQLDARQPLDAELTAIAGLTSAADRVPYFTGSGTAALATFSTFGRSLVDDADAAAGRTTLGLGTIATQAANSVSITGGSITGITDLAVADGGTGVSTITGIIRGNGTSPFTAAVAGTDFLAPAAIGVTVQAFDADLAAIAALTSAADRLPYFTGSGTAALATFTSAGRALLDDADAAAQRTTLGATTTGSALFTAADAAAAQTAIGATVTGSALITATDAAAARAAIGAGITTGTAVAATSGTAIDYTGLPAGLNRITIVFDNVSLSANASLIVQVGSGSFTTSGYGSGSYGTNNSGSTATTGFLIIVSSAALAFAGSMTLHRSTGNTWVSSHTGLLVGTAVSVVGGGRVAIGGTLDRVRITTNGADTFDAGTVNVFWE